MIHAATPSDIIATFATLISPENLSADLIGKAKEHILDTLACGVAGACSDEGGAVLDLLIASDETGAVPVWGTDRALNARAAAFCNGVACHAFELDDTAGCDHSGAVVIPAAVAALHVADRPVSGAEFLTAVVLGYEIARRVMDACGGYWPHNEAGWHSTATCGTFGAALAAGRILKLDQRQLVHALGHAASFSGGLWAFIHDASQTKRIHAGRAAEGGLTAVLLARGGVTGPRMIFEDVWGGFLGTIAPSSAAPARLTEDLGERWVFAQTAIKPHASCRGTHSAIDVLNELLTVHGLAVEDIKSIHALSPPALEKMCGGRDLSSLASAQMSMPFAIASRLLRGSVGIDAFAEERRRDPVVLSLIDRVVLVADAGMASSDEPIVTVETMDGRTFRRRIADPLGSPTNPVSKIQLAAKARRLLGMALGDTAVERVINTLAALESIDDVRALPGLLAGTERPPRFR